MATAVTTPLWLAELVAASPETLGLVMLAADPHARRLDQATQRAAVGDALADGASAAEAMRQRFPGLGPQQIAHALGVTIEAVDDDPVAASLWRFAEYRQRQVGILLYARGIAPLERAIVDDLATQLLGLATLRDVFVAHELFHHLEAIRSEPPIARRYQPTLFRIGNWHWRSGIAALAEIAAGAFAQTLLDLPCHPKVMDLVALDAVGAGTAAADIAARVAAIGAARLAIPAGLLSTICEPAPAVAALRRGRGCR
jgi:hypothetical protein